LWRAARLGVHNLGPMTANGIYQMITRRDRQAGVDAWPRRFRHHFSHTWLDCGGPEGDLMELNGWSSPQMLRRYGASAQRPGPPYLPTASWKPVLDGTALPGRNPDVGSGHLHAS
jgi:integrase